MINLICCESVCLMIRQRFCIVWTTLDSCVLMRYARTLNLEYRVEESCVLKGKIHTYILTYVFFITPLSLGSPQLYDIQAALVTDLITLVYDYYCL